MNEQLKAYRRVYTMNIPIPVGYTKIYIYNNMFLCQIYRDDFSSWKEIAISFSYKRIKILFFQLYLNEFV